MTYGEFYKSVCYNCVKMFMTDRLNEVIQKENYNVDIKDLLEYDTIQHVMKKSTEELMVNNQELLNSLIDSINESLDKTLLEMGDTILNKECK